MSVLVFGVFGWCLCGYDVTLLLVFCLARLICFDIVAVRWFTICRVFLFG